MSSGESNSSDNPGTILASAVDAEIATFRAMQETMQHYQSNAQLVQSQRTENEMVLEEFQVLIDSKKKKKKKNADSKQTATTVVVYKMIGPVLLSQNLNDAFETVEKRIQFITSEQTKIQTQINHHEQLLQEQSKTVQHMQSMLQQSTVQAVQAIATAQQQHAAS